MDTSSESPRVRETRSERILVLGGTAWLGREIAAQAVAAGHHVTCLARGESGSVADGAILVATDRSRPDAYDAVRNRDWDQVVEVSWQPGMVRGALAALGARAAHWTYVSSISVYAPPGVGEIDESHDVVEGTRRDEVTIEDYAAAKVTCEQASSAVVADRLLVVRAGLIGGPGDETDRTGYWLAAAARDPSGPLLVPDAPDLPVQVVDVRNLAGWLLAAGSRGLVGPFDVVGPVVLYPEWVELSRQLAGHTGEVVIADAAWLLAQGVGEWRGPGSFPLWVASDRGIFSGAKAAAEGLVNRPTADMLADTLTWEREQGVDRQRRAGLSTARAQELLSLLRS